MTHPTYKTYQFQITQFEFKKPIRKKRKNLKKNFIWNIRLLSLNY